MVRVVHARAASSFLRGSALKFPHQYSARLHAGGRLASAAPVRHLSRSATPCHLAAFSHGRVDHVGRWHDVLESQQCLA